MIIEIFGKNFKSLQLFKNKTRFILLKAFIALIYYRKPVVYCQIFPNKILIDKLCYQKPSSTLKIEYFFLNTYCIGPQIYILK